MQQEVFWAICVYDDYYREFTMICNIGFQFLYHLLIIIVNSKQIGPIAQMTRALDLHSRGRGFDSHSVHNKGLYLSWLEKQTHNLKVVGSSPSRPTKCSLK